MLFSFVKMKMTKISISSFLIFNLLIKPLKVFLNAQIDVHYNDSFSFNFMGWHKRSILLNIYNAIITTNEEWII